MRRIAALCLGLVTFAALGAAGALGADAPEPFRYREAGFESARLTYVNGLPVLSLAGTPEEMGNQAAALNVDGLQGILDYPPRLLQAVGREDRWPALLAAGAKLVAQFPPDHLAELEAYARKSRIDRQRLIGINTMVDSYRGGFGCSSLIVEPSRSKAEGPLFGRNLDFITGSILQRYSLVTVYRPNGKRAFASVGFPGLIGCLSGMNDAGLALATHEVFLSGDKAPLFDPRGTPYTLLFRRILEECATVAEAEALVRAARRTTLFNLALCDRREALVLEATPRTVAVRRAEEGLLACTNHFRTPELSTPLRLPARHIKLMRSQAIARLDLADVARKLHEVHQGRLTLQTMVFEPASLRLHLAIGACPSSALPLKSLDLRPLFRGERPVAHRTPTAGPTTPAVPSPGDRMPIVEWLGNPGPRSAPAGHWAAGPASCNNPGSVPLDVQHGPAAQPLSLQ